MEILLSVELNKIHKLYFANLSVLEETERRLKFAKFVLTVDSQNLRT
jgi:hypothetical protein